MSVIGLETTAQSPTRRMPFGNLNNNTGANEPRPKAKLWLNIGYEVAGKFINTPMGLAIDTMELADVRGQNVEWVKQRTAQNDLVKQMQKLGMSLQPGEERIIFQQAMPGGITWSVRLRRVNEELAVAQNENEFAVDFASLFAAPMAEMPQAAE